MSDDLATRVRELCVYAAERAKAQDIVEVQRAADALLGTDDESLKRSDPAITRDLLDGAAVVFNAGDVQRAAALMGKGIHALDANPGATRVDLIVPLNNLIAVYDQTNDYQQAGSVASVLGRIVEQLDEPLTMTAATVLIQMGQNYEQRGQLGPALVMYRPLHEFMMTSPEISRDTALAWVARYIQTLMAAERYDAVRSLGYEVLESAPDDMKIELFLIIAEAAMRQGNAAEREETLDRAVALAERLDEGGALTPRGQIAAGAVYHNLAVHYLAQQRAERYARGQELLRREIAILLANGHGGSAEHAGALGQLASLTDASRDIDAAERLYGEAISVYETANDTPPAEFSDFLTDLGMLRLRHGRAADAVGPFQRALQLRDANESEDAGRRANAASNLATAYFEAGDLSAASSHFDRAIDLRFSA